MPLNIRALICRGQSKPAYRRGLRGNSAAITAGRVAQLDGNMVIVVGLPGVEYRPHNACGLGSFPGCLVQSSPLSIICEEPVPIRAYLCSHHTMYQLLGFRPFTDRSFSRCVRVRRCPIW